VFKRWLISILIPTALFALAGCATQAVKPAAAEETTAPAKEDPKPAAVAELAVQPVAARQPAKHPPKVRLTPRKKAITPAPAASATPMTAAPAESKGRGAWWIVLILILLAAAAVAARNALRRRDGARSPPARPGGPAPPR